MTQFLMRRSSEALFLLSLLFGAIPAAAVIAVDMVVGLDHTSGIKGGYGLPSWPWQVAAVVGIVICIYLSILAQRKAKLEAPVKEAAKEIERVQNAIAVLEERGYTVTWTED